MSGTIAACALGPWVGPPGRPAVVVDSNRYIFDQIHEASLKYAHALYELGLRPGDRVGIFMPNGVAWIETLLGAALIGAAAVPLNTRYELEELRYVAGHAEIKAIVTTRRRAGNADLVEVARRCLPEAWGGEPPDGYARLPIRHILIEGAEEQGAISPEHIGDASPKPNPARVRHIRAIAQSVRPTDVAAVLYTSGTTSNPKGCLMSHEALVRTGVARFEERRLTAEPLTVWTPCPLYHAGALVPLLGCLASGATFVTSTTFDAAQALALLERERVTTALPIFSYFTDALLDSPEFNRTDLSGLRDILTTGPPSGTERAQQCFAPAKLVAAYGMTELGGVAASSPADESDEDRLIWSGRPFEGIEMVIVNPETGHQVPPGNVGEIAARGYCSFSGYLHDDEATAAAFDNCGWFHTGDMGIASADGRIAFRGRFKDMLKVGGENVSALEVEEFVSRHPAVRRAEVVGAPDERLNEVVAVFIELEPGRTASAEEIISFCRGRIARFKVPRLVRFVAAGTWPMSATKVDKVTLRHWVTDGSDDLPSA